LQLALEAHQNPGTDVEPTAWIAARYEAESLPDEMLLGDGSWPGSGDHHNRPLPNFLPYRVFLRAVTVTNVSQPPPLLISPVATSAAGQACGNHFLNRGQSQKSSFSCNMIR